MLAPLRLVRVICACHAARAIELRRLAGGRNSIAFDPAQRRRRRRQVRRGQAQAQAARRWKRRRRKPGARTSPSHCLAAGCTQHPDTQTAAVPFWPGAVAALRACRMDRPHLACTPTWVPASLVSQLLGGPLPTAHVELVICGKKSAKKNTVRKITLGRPASPPTPAPAPCVQSAALVASSPPPASL